MGIEEYLLGGLLLATLIAFVSFRKALTGTRRQAYEPVKVSIARSASNKAYTSRSDHILE